MPEALYFTEIASPVHRLQCLAAQEDHVGRQAPAFGDPVLHRHRIHRVQLLSCFAIGDRATLGAEVIRGVEAERRARGHADIVVRDRTQDDGAGRETETIYHHGFAGSAQAHKFVEVGSDAAAAITRDTNARMARSQVRQQETRREQNRHEFHVPTPSAMRETAAASCELEAERT